MDGEVRRASFLDANTLNVWPAFTASATDDVWGHFTLGGIDFQVHSRDDWLDDQAPVDYDKQGWYLDVDVSSEGTPAALGGGGPFQLSDLWITLYKDRASFKGTYFKSFEFVGALWGTALWGVDIWPESLTFGIQLGMNLFFRQISHRLVSQVAGQRLRVSGWTYHFQTLGKLRVS